MSTAALIYRSPAPVGENVSGERNYTHASIGDFIQRVGQIPADFPSYADWDMALPAGHWRVLADAFAAPPSVEAMREASNQAADGPWRVVRYGDGDSLVIHDARGDWRVCFMATAGDNGDMRQIEANAELIVTAVNFVRAALTTTPEGASA